MQVTLKAFTLASLVTLSSVWVAPCYAASELVIQDSAGITRAASDVEGMGKIEFSLIDAQGAPAEGAEVTLTNATSGEVLTAVSSQGLASFEGISPGVWTVASNTAGVTFTNVGVTSLSVASLGGLAGGLSGLGISASAASAVAGGAAVVAGGAAVISSKSSSSATPLSPAS